MKINKQFICCSLWFFCLLSLFCCKKGEMAVTNPPRIVSITVRGYTLTDTLEFVKGGKVIGQTDEGHAGFEVKVLLKDSTDILQIRRKGQTTILDTRVIRGPYLENITYYFDGEKIYPDFVDLQVKGYAKNDTLEFVIDNKVLGWGAGAVFPALYIGIQANKKTLLQIRKKGTTEALLEKEIVAVRPTAPLTFYYDGTKIFDRITLPAPVNAANMIVRVSFTSQVDVFRGPVDLIFYTGNILKPYDQFTATTLRIELPADGNFSKDIELPALPPFVEKFDEIVYNFRLVKRGTLTALPYDTTNEPGTITPQSGFFFGEFKFTPGGAAILILNEQKIFYDWDITTSFYVRLVKNIAPYFQ